MRSVIRTFFIFIFVSVVVLSRRQPEVHINPSGSPAFWRYVLKVPGEGVLPDVTFPGPWRLTLTRKFIVLVPQYLNSSNRVLLRESLRLGLFPTVPLVVPDTPCSRSPLPRPTGVVRPEFRWFPGLNRKMVLEVYPRQLSVSLWGCPNFLPQRGYPNSTSESRVRSHVVSE